VSLFRDFVERLRVLVFRSREARELDEELRFHVEMETAQLERSGLSDAESRRRGVIALGGVERIKEDVRDAWGTRLLEDTASDVGYTLRTLSRSPGFAIVAILTLAVGIGGTTAVFSAVDAVLLQPLPYQQPGQLVRLYQNYGRLSPDERGFVTPVHFLDYRSKVAAFAATAAILNYSESGADIGTGDNVRRIRLLPVSADYFEVIRVQPAVGRAFERQQETGARVVILSHALWERQSRGDPAAVGQTLTMNGLPYTIAGVMPNGFTDPLAGEVDAWVPADLTPGTDAANNASNHYLSVVARLRPGVSTARAQAELDVLGTALARQYPNAVDKRARIYPLKEDIVGSSSLALEIMLGAVVMVLVLVCVNMANLLLVRGTERAREFALRSALGAERTRLVRQMLIESLTLALLGDIAGLIVARLAMSAIVLLGSGSIPRLARLTLDPRLLAFSVIVASLSAVGFGLWPAVRVGRTDPSDALREHSRSATSGGAQMRLRDWLVVSQVALAFVLLVGAGLLIASFQRIRELDLGVQPNGAFVFELNLPAARYDSTKRAQFYEELARQIGGLAGVRAVGGVSRLPVTGPYHEWGAQALTGPLAHSNEYTGAEHRIVSGDYFHAAGIPLLEGRLFDGRDDSAAPDRVIVSRAMAQRLFPGVPALGQRLRAGGHNSDVVGVVGDVASDAEGHPDVYVYHAHAQFAGNRNWPLTQVVRVNGSLERAQSEARRVLASLDPQLVMYRPMSLADAIGRGQAQRAFTLRLLVSFAIIALAIAALGLFGVLSYGVRLRAREFGIRMALGAERGVVRRMVLRQGLTLTAIGTVIGLLGAAAMARLLAALVFRVSPLDPAVLSAAVIVMAIVAAVAAYLPARRATSVDPRTALQ
jgi:putative ABC transport system permease protein